MNNDVNDTQEFLRGFHNAVQQWSSSARKVEATADFGAPGGDAEKQHKIWLNVHSQNTAKLRQLFASSDARDDIEHPELAAAAKVSPQELRNIRASLS